MIRTFDSRGEYRHLQPEIDAAIRRVLDSGRLILGPEVDAFETEFAAFVGAQHAVGVKSGTDALIIALKALEVGQGDEVITVANTAVPTVSAIRAVGASPRFVDVDPDTLLMDPAQLSNAANPRTRCIIPVHLYGMPVDIRRITAVARRHRIPVISDCAQAHGAYYDGRHVGTVCDIGCFSFYPTKNLGALGDAGMCTTNDLQLAARMRQLRMYGFDGDRVAHCEGLCSRLDELQAAILRVKLTHLPESLRIRRRLARLYSLLLRDSDYRLPPKRDKSRHAFHLYVIRTPNREWTVEALQKAEIGYGVHYPVPIHLMPAYEWLGYRAGDLPVTEKAAREVLSLPLHPGLTDNDIRQVADVLIAAQQIQL